MVEIDPVPALEAHMEGYRVARLDDALPDADIVVTATGTAGALGPDSFAHLGDGAVLANAGHDDREIDVVALRACALGSEPTRAGVETLTLADGRRVHLLGEGRLVNIAGGDGHPVEIMDLSFSVQALAAHLLASQTLEPACTRSRPSSTGGDRADEARDARYRAGRRADLVRFGHG